MNLYKLLTESEQEQVNLYSQKINTKHRAEPAFYKNRLVSDYILQLFREHHPDLAEEIRIKQEKKNEITGTRLKELPWDACIYGFLAMKSDEDAETGTGTGKNKKKKN